MGSNNKKSNINNSAPILFSPTVFHVLVKQFYQKRFYTRGTLTSIRISQLAKLITTLYRVGWDPWNKKKDNYLSCIEGKGGGKDIHCVAQNAALFVDLL